MEKKAVLSVFALLLILSAFSFVQAQIDPVEELEKINKAYQCLEDKVQETTCSSLSTQEKIFTLLSIDECQTELMSESQNDGECWSLGGSTSCDIKTTAQAILALENTGVNTEKEEAWLISKNTTATELAWYLEIENSEPATCSIEYAGLSPYTVTIGEEGKLSNDAGSCLTLAQDDNWLRISPSCFDQEFKVSCDQNFLTTLLFQKINSPTIQVLQSSSSSSAFGTTTEKVDSTCFSQGSGCNYEGTLWASLVLNSLGKDINSNLPYLVTLTEENLRFIPESFLYSITSNLEYRTATLSKQISSKWWEESGDKFYDTPLALYPFQQEESLGEKINSKEWLLDVQDENGCWDSNVRNTAFILASIWPKTFGGSGDGEGLPDCGDAGYFCTSVSSCSGNLLSEFDCPSLLKCCSVAPIQETCSEQGGTICNSNQFCSGGNQVSTGDLSSGETCCVEGACQTSTPPSESTECALGGGECRTTGCNSNEKESFLSCEFGGDSCCTTKSPGGGGSFWIWFFLILIILVVVGIIFREKLRDFWFGIQSRFGRSSRRPSGSGRPGPGYGRPPPHHPLRHVPERRILLPAETRQPTRHAPPRKSGAQKELDNVLKKLKDMGK